MSTTCPKCHRALKVEDVVVKSYIPVIDLQTCGKIRITKRGRVAAKRIQSGDGIICEGAMEGKVETEGTVKLGPKSSWKGASLKSRSLTIVDGAKLLGDVKISGYTTEPKLPPVKTTKKTAGAKLLDALTKRGAGASAKKRKQAPTVKKEKTTAVRASIARTATQRPATKVPTPATKPTAKPTAPSTAATAAKTPKKTKKKAQRAAKIAVRTAKKLRRAVVSKAKKKKKSSTTKRPARAAARTTKKARKAAAKKVTKRTAKKIRKAAAKKATKRTAKKSAHKAVKKSMRKTAKKGAKKPVRKPTTKKKRR